MYRAWWLVVAGCGRIGFDPLGGSANGDAYDGDAIVTSTNCVSPGNPERFPTQAQACLGWGGTGGAGAFTMVQSAGTLTITIPAGDAQAEGACAGTVVPFAHGVFAEISQITDSPVLTYLEAISGSRDLSIQGSTSLGLTFYDDFTSLVPELPYDPVAMRWWRIRPDETGTATVFETAPDGLMWTTQATSSAPPGTVTPRIRANPSGLASATPTSAIFNGVDACP